MICEWDSMLLGVSICMYILKRFLLQNLEIPEFDVR